MYQLITKQPKSSGASLNRNGQPDISFNQKQLLTTIHQSNNEWALMGVKKQGVLNPAFKINPRLNSLRLLNLVSLRIQITHTTNKTTYKTYAKLITSITGLRVGMSSNCLGNYLLHD